MLCIKKISSLILAFVLVTAWLLPGLPAVAAPTASGTCGNDLTWTLDETGTLTISGSGSMRFFVTSPWAQYASSITKVSIGEGITSICPNMFRGCTNLTGIWVAAGNSAYSSDACGVLFDRDKTWLVQYPCVRSGEYVIPESVCSIRSEAFRNCANLTAVTIPQAVTTIPEYAFDGCTGLASVSLPDNLEWISYAAFRDCAALTEIRIPDSVGVLEDYAFQGCTGLTSVAIPDGIIYLECALFRGCSNLTAVSIPDSVTAIEQSAFQDCGKLASVTLPAELTDISHYAFQNCASLTSVSIPKGVTWIGDGAFRGCERLASVSFPEGITEIYAYAFEDCVSLTSVTLPASLSSFYPSAFAGCSGLTGNFVHPNTPFYTSDASGVLMTKNQTTLVRFPGSYSGTYMLPDSVTGFETHAFSGCGSLTGFQVSETHPLYSTDDSGVIYNKDKTVLVLFPSGFRGSYRVPDGVYEIGPWSCADTLGLTAITLPNSVTMVSSGAFYGNTALKEIFFTGNRPGINSDAIQNATATAYYPLDDADWAEWIGSRTNDTVTWVGLGTAGQRYYNVAPFRSGETPTHPTLEGHVFAGWYQDPEFTQPLGKDAAEGNAYAKFVSDRVLSVKWQVTGGTNAGSDSTTLRLVTTVDGLDYSRVGFRFLLGEGKWNTRTSRTVYSQIKSSTASVIFNYKPNVFHESSQYFLTRTITGVPNSCFDRVWTVTPFWVTLDGTEVEGVTRTFQISDFYNR